MDSFPTTFVASIETAEGKCVQHPWHLGTIEPVARHCVEHVYRGRQLLGLPVLTVALKFGGKIVDVFDGKDWMNQFLVKADAEYAGDWS